jgi:anti-sigma factor RsiW
MEQLIAYLEGLLGPDQAAQLQAHLEICAACLAEYEAFLHLRQRLLALGQSRSKT